MMYLLIPLFFLNSCKPMYNSSYKKPFLADTKSSVSVKKLHKRLFYISKSGFGVGHEDTTAYGIEWNCMEAPKIAKSDVNEVVGDFPVVYGFDISKIELDHSKNIDGVPFDAMRELIVDAYRKGGIITISWHADNPISGGDSWDKTPAVIDIIGNGSQIKKYDIWIGRVAQFLGSLTYQGRKIPIIFRPFHEMNGDWFWWGKPNCSSVEYVQLWRKTVRLLRDEHNLHNLIYAYSPNTLIQEEDYLEYYPGDNYVDILGIDIYDFNNAEGYMASVVNNLKVLKDIATTKNKLYAFTETGLETISQNNWFTQVLYPNIENSGIAWVLFWRNHSKTHHYVPYKNHGSEKDFKAFKELPQALFLKDINKLKF